jgi:molybdopterin/thiamine biosynthesis adenylyltransferase
MGVIQATEAVKYLSGEGELLTDRLLTYDALAFRWREIPVQRSRHCPLCGDAPIITGLHSEEQTQGETCAAGATC